MMKDAVVKMMKNTVVKMMKNTVVNIAVMKGCNDEGVIDSV